MKRLLLTAAAASVLSLASGVRAAGDQMPPAATASPADTKAASTDTKKSAKAGDDKLPWQAKTSETKASEDTPEARGTGSGGLYSCGSTLSMKGR